MLLLLRWVRAGPRFSAFLAGVALVGFVGVVGAEPSVLRAGVMGAVGLLALALGRQRSAVPALAVAVICVVTYDPAMSVSFGFALSVVATAGIVLLAPGWSTAMARRGVPRGIAAALAVPTAAFLATAPVVTGMAGRISLVAIPANLLAAPVLAPVTILGVLAMLLAPVWPGGAELLVRLADPGLAWLILVARKAAAVPGALLHWPAGWWGGLLAALVAAALVSLIRIRTGRVMVFSAVLALLLVLVPVRVFAPPWPPHGWSFVACEVGQGDALVLATGVPGSAVVVDTGPRPGLVDRCLDRLDVHRVPLLVLTHLHADHIGGLEGVLAGRAVGAVAVGPGRIPTWARRQVAEQADAAGVPLRAVGKGQVMRWPALRLTVLGPEYVPPPGAADQDEGSVVNNTSVVMRADTPAGRILLTGDVELTAQADLLASDVDLRADILKVPHHGSGVFLPRFVDAVDPAVAVISVGADNDYGHPSIRTLRVLRTGGALIARTDRSGGIALVPENGEAVVVPR